MNPILENKTNELENASDYECWYLVKQPTAFDNICYLVSFLKEFKEHDMPENLQDFIGKKVSLVNQSKPSVEISNGLIKMTSSKYEEAIITETFDEICARCGGEFEKKELYSDIIQRQIEKMYISSTVDEGYNGVRQKYRLYPVMLLYKVLIELGRSTGNYAVTTTEYRYLVATTEVFEQFLETLLLIKLLREDVSANAAFEQFRSKFDNRLIQALKQLPTLQIDKDSIKLNPETIDEVAKKVFIFESNPNIFATDNYLEFLGSTKSLFELEKFEDEDGANNDVQHTNTDIDRLTGGTNIILYGVPGAGKSWTIKNDYCNDADLMERLVFHPDYTYSDFVGQILPTVAEDGSVSYVFTPGPFTKLVRKAYLNPDKMFYLIIEEINRGNAPAIFGDIFQLLDRNQAGGSEYEITNADIARIVYDDESHKVSIPSNMSILCTMNTSDQNVFTLDTAFQRRWNMRLIKNRFQNNRDERDFAETKILDTSVTWEHFFTEINKIVLSKNIRMTSSEDKRLGTHFVAKEDLLIGDGSERQISRFPEKVLKYLWDDAFKFTKEDVFDLDKVKSLEDVIELFVTSKNDGRFLVFKENIFNALVPKKSS